MNRFLGLTLLAFLGFGIPAAAQQTDPSLLTVQRIYGTPEFAAQPFGPPAGWATAARTRRSSPAGGRRPGHRPLRRGDRQARGPGRGEAARARGATRRRWTSRTTPGRPTASRLLIFTNTQPVWRLNTRGDYWVLDRERRQAPQAGRREAKPSTLMFAKFSPDGGRVGYVRENNLYVEDLASGAITALTTDGSPHAHQRHLRLGVRRGADELLRRRLALEPGRAAGSPTGSSTPTG